MKDDEVGLIRDGDALSCQRAQNENRDQIAAQERDRQKPTASQESFPNQRVEDGVHVRLPMGPNHRTTRDTKISSSVGSQSATSDAPIAWARCRTKSTSPGHT